MAERAGAPPIPGNEYGDAITERLRSKALIGITTSLSVLAVTAQLFVLSIDAAEQWGWTAASYGSLDVTEHGLEAHHTFRDMRVIKIILAPGARSYIS